MRLHLATTALPARRTGVAWRAELGWFLLAYVVYTASRWVFAGELDTALANARGLYEAEQAAGVAIEGAVQDALDSAAVSWLLANVYLAAQLVVLPGALLWLYRRSGEVYRVLRTTVIATWLIAIPVFALLPVAPPRLAGIGLADTVSEQAAVALTGQSTVFYNPFAAVPSLHVGFAFAIGIAVAATLRGRGARVAALLWGPVVTVAVVATGNHYVVDVLAGLVVTVAGLVAGRLVTTAAARRSRGAVTVLAPGVPTP
jgi:hypothetical protein